MITKILGEGAISGVFPAPVKAFSIEFYGVAGIGNVHLHLFDENGYLLSKIVIPNPKEEYPYGFSNSDMNIKGFSLYSDNKGGLSIYEIRYALAAPIGGGGGPPTGQYYLDTFTGTGLLKNHTADTGEGWIEVPNSWWGESNNIDSYTIYSNGSMSTEEYFPPAAGPDIDFTAPYTVNLDFFLHSNYDPQPVFGFGTQVDGSTWVIDAYFSGSYVNFQLYYAYGTFNSEASLMEPDLGDATLGDINNFSVTVDGTAVHFFMNSVYYATSYLNHTGYGKFWVGLWDCFYWSGGNPIEPSFALNRLEITEQEVLQPTATQITSGVTQNPSNVTAYKAVFYKITIGSGATNLNIVINNNAGSFDLYAKKDSYPQASDLQDSGTTYLSHNIGSPTAGLWYIVVRYNDPFPSTRTTDITATVT